MTTGIKPDLSTRIQGGGQVQRSGSAGWQLEIPAGDAGNYRLAQLDDYEGLSRGTFPWRAPLKLSLTARISSRVIPGTWGFGLWNDPFGMVVIRGSKIRFPTLPNAAWFFFASDPNYLSLRDDLPADGSLAAVFRSPNRMPINLIATSPVFSLIFLPPVSRMLRRWLRQHVQQDTLAFDLDATEWHAYQLEWGNEQVVFQVDGRVLQETALVPTAPLGLVIWVDNQFVRWEPDGQLGYGTLANQDAARLQIVDLEISLA